MSWRHRDILEAELHEPKGFTTANNGDSIWRNEQGLSEWTDREVLPAALNFVDASVAPPTTGTGDIYVLSLGASIHANWGTVALKDWVRYDGVAWKVITPSKSILCYDKTEDVLMSYDGSVWATVGGGDNISNADLTFDGSYYADLNDNSWQLKDSTGANRLLLDVQQGNANGHGIGYGGSFIDGKHTFYNIATNGTQALGQMSFLNGLKLSNGSLEQDYLNFGSGGFVLHIKSHVSYGSSIGVYPNITLTTRHSSTGIVFDTNNFTSFKKNGTEHSRVDSSSNWILKGSAVIGSEKISLQDDTLVKGSDTSASTTGFKVTDSTNASLLEVKNNGKTDFNTTDTVLINNGTKNVGVPSWSTHTYWGLDNGNGTRWDLLSANTSGGMNAGEFGITENGSGIVPFRIFDNDKVALGNIHKANLDTNYSVNIADGLLIKNGNFKLAKVGTGSQTFTIETKVNQEIRTLPNVYPVFEFDNNTTSYRIGNADSASSTYNEGDFFIYNASTVKNNLLITKTGQTIISNGGTSVIGTEDISLQGDTLLNANVNMANLPTSSAGLSSGDIWNNSGVLNIV